MESRALTRMLGWNNCEFNLRKIGDGIINHYNANTLALNF